jgi:glycosyltransferase involved in cell wall biosynthesis
LNPSSHVEYRPIPRRVVYAVNHSFPFSTNGYAVRSHAVAMALNKRGFNTFVVSNMGGPLATQKLSGQNWSPALQIDGVRYLRLFAPNARAGVFESNFQSSIEKVIELLRVFKPAVVMAASNWQSAMPSAVAARELAIPFFYEVRGFWEITRLAYSPTWSNSSEFRLEVEQETAMARRAERVFTLNRFMRDELKRRGVPVEKIHLVPNGFPGSAAPSVRSVTREELGISSRFVVGYIGSFNIYEGLEDLIRAVALVRRHGVDVSLLLVGSAESRGFGLGDPGNCPVTTSYRRLAKDLSISESLFMPGRIATAMTGAYYSLLDLVIIPRRPYAVCELVSPMKPLEAVSHGVRVLMSDVDPLVDLAELSSRFYYFRKGDLESLVEQLMALLHDVTAPRAHNEILSSRSWEANVAPIADAIKDIR